MPARMRALAQISDFTEAEPIVNVPPVSRGVRGAVLFSLPALPSLSFPSLPTSLTVGVGPLCPSQVITLVTTSSLGEQVFVKRFELYERCALNQTPTLDRWVGVVCCAPSVPSPPVHDGVGPSGETPAASTAPAPARRIPVG